MAAAYLASHMQMQHRISDRDTVPTVPLCTTPFDYHLTFPRTANTIYCPVKVCLGRSTNRSNLQIYFMPHHFKYTKVVFNESTIPHPRCKQSNMFFPRELLMYGHLSTKIE